MKWQNCLGWVVKYIIVFLISILSVSLTSAQESIFGEEKIYDGIFSPDGNLLAAKTAERVLVFDTGSLQLIKILSTRGLVASKLAFSSDSRYLAWSEGFPGKGVGVWDFFTSRQVAYFQLNAFYGPDLVFVPGGKLLAVQVTDYVGIGTPDPGIIHFWKVGTWEKHGNWRPPGNGTISNLAFTYDGTRFSATSVRGPVGEWVHEKFVVDVQTLKLVDSREIQEGDERIIAYSPDGRFEVVLVDWGDRAVLIRNPRDHTQIALLSDPVVGYLFFRGISLDSKWLATVQNQVIIWNTNTWEIEYRLTLPAGQLVAHGFAKDTYWYAGLAPTGELRIWDLISQNIVVTGVFPLSDMKITPWGHIRMIR